MTDREAPATEAGRKMLSAWLYGLAGPAQVTFARDILAIEAEASVPAAPLTAEALARIVIDGFREGAASREELCHWIVREDDERHHADNACVECVPDGPMLVDGFRCVPHQARAYLGFGSFTSLLQASPQPAAPQPDEALRAALVGVLDQFDHWTSEPRPAIDGGTVRLHNFTEVQPEMERAITKARAALAPDDLRCVFPDCVSTDRHSHGGLPGGYENPDDPDGPPIKFTAEPVPGVRDYNGALLAAPPAAPQPDEALRAALTKIWIRAGHAQDDHVPDDSGSVAEDLQIIEEDARAALAAKG